jgi:ABC-type Fe3+ transport system substrate-binding protein
MTSKTLALALACAALLSIRGAQAATVEEIATLSGPDRQKILEDGAKKEGEMLWVGSFGDETGQPIVRAFMAKYPAIKVSRIRTDSGKALQRVLAEHRAKTPRVDLITTSTVTDLKAADLVQPFKTPALDVLAPDARDPQGYVAPLYFSYFGLVAYNTKLVTAAEAPKIYDDLLDPKWKGQMVWGDSDTTAGPFVVTFLRNAWGEDKAAAYLKKLSEQKIVTRNASARNVLDITIAGEHKIMINPVVSHVGLARKEGAPVEVNLADPVPSRSTGFMMLKEAPHPHATMLMIDFLLSPDAQKFLRDDRYFPSNPTVKAVDEMQAYAPEARGLKKFFLDEEMMDKSTPKSMEMFKQLFQ